MPSVTFEPGAIKASPHPSPGRYQRTASVCRRLKDQRQAIEYQAVPTHNPEEPRRHETSESKTWGEEVLESHTFTNIFAVIILANGVVIGLETDIRSFGGWEFIEAAFLVVFLGEVIFKIYVEGTRFWHPHEEDFIWNVFDVLIVGLGLFDLVASLVGISSSGGFATIFRMVRLLRVLRIVRLLKFLKPLIMLAFGLIEACKAILWVTILMGAVLYVTSIVLVRTVGDPSPSDPHYEFLVDHFETIPTSMITLFVLMSSPNLPIYQEEDGLLSARPMFCTFLIMFICFGSFGMIAMLTGVINESMFDNNELRKQEKKIEHENMRASLGQHAADLYETLPVDSGGCVNVDDLKEVAGPAAHLLDQAGVQFAHGDVLQFLELMDEEEAGFINMKEFVHAMEKMAEGLSPLAIVQVQHTVGLCNKKLSRQIDNMADIQEQMESQVEKTSEEVEKILKLITEEHDNHRNHFTEKFEAQMQKTSDEVDRILKIVTDNHDEHQNHLSEKMEAMVSHTSEEVDRILQIVTENHQAVTEDQNEHRNHLANHIADKMESAMLRTSEEVDRILQIVTEDRDEHRNISKDHWESQMRCTEKEGDRILQAISKDLDENRSHLVEKIDSQKNEHQTLVIDKIEAHELRMAEQVDRILNYLTNIEPNIPAAASARSARGFVHAESQLQVQSEIRRSESSLLAAMSKQARDGAMAVQNVIDKKFSDLERQSALRDNLRDSNEKRMQIAMMSQIQGLVQEACSQTKLHEIHCLVQDLHMKEDMIENLRSDLVRLMQESKNSVVRVAKTQDTINEDVDILMSKMSELEKQADSAHAQFVTSTAELGGDIITSISELISTSLSTMRQEFEMQRFQTLSSISREDEMQRFQTVSTISREDTSLSSRDAAMSFFSREVTRTSVGDTPSLQSKNNF